MQDSDSQVLGTALKNLALGFDQMPKNMVSIHQLLCVLFTTEVVSFSRNKWCVSAFFTNPPINFELLQMSLTLNFLTPKDHHASSHLGERPRN